MSNYKVEGVEAGPADGIPGRWCCQEVSEAWRGALPPQGLGPASRGCSEGSGGQQNTAPTCPLCPRITTGLRLNELEHPGGKAGIHSYLNVHLTIPAPLTLAECPH